MRGCTVSARLKRWAQENKHLQTFLVFLLFNACAEQTRPIISQPAPAPQVFVQECTGVRVQFSLERKPRSESVYDVYVTDLSGQPLADITRVVLAFTSLGTERSTTTRVAQPTVTGHYVSTSGLPLAPGAWQVDTIVRQASGSEAVCTFYLNL
jgi:hypothetical protein